MKQSNANMSETDWSPIKDRPLRQAGQSLKEERRALFADKLEPYLLIAVCLLAGNR